MYFFIITSLTKDIGKFSSVTDRNVIRFYVEFSESVNVTGNPLLHLNLTKNGSNKSATYLSGTNTNILTFEYTVEIDDNISNLNATTLSTGSDVSTVISLNGGTIKDNNNNNADLSSLSDNDTTNTTSIDTTQLVLSDFIFTDLTNDSDNVNRTNNHLVGFKFTSNKASDKASVSVTVIGLNQDITYNNDNNVWEVTFDTYVTNGESTTINDVKSGSYTTTLGETIGYFLSSVRSEKISGASIDDILQGYRDTCYQTSSLASLHPMNYEDFLEKSLDTVDSYGLGISIMKVLKLITCGYTPLEKERELGALAFKMYHPSILQRIRIEEATLLYEKFLEKHVLKKNEHFVNHKIVKKTKIAKKIDNVLDKIELKDVKMNKKQMDQVSIEPIKECIKGKEYNPIILE